MKALGSLTNRIFLASALLAVLSIATAIFVVNDRVTREAEAELRRGLNEAGRLVEQHRATLFEHFTRMAHLIADLPKLKAAVDLGDPPTMQPLAAEYRERVNSALFLVTDRTGRLLAAAGALAETASGAQQVLPVRNALAGLDTAAFWPTAVGLLQVVTVPIAIGPAPPEVLGTLSLGFRLDDHLAAQFKAVTESEVSFAVDGRVQASTLPRRSHAALERLLGGPATARLWLDDQEYVALLQPMTPGGWPGNHMTADGSHVPIAVILRSRTERLRFLRSLHTALAATALLAVVLGTLLSYGVARTVTRPLGAITATMREMAATGDLTLKMELPSRGRWQDEDARLLATTFNTMTGAITRFQHEAAQRERLSSLGRLSTVIAHEVRNPLMIIKSALRTLRLAHPPSTDARRAIDDIDEEVARLNRIVTEVLDFARPIRFEYGRVNIRDLCEASAAAAAAGDAHFPVRVVTDDALPEIETDGEHLRLALVNILVNARHAVAARGSSGEAGTEAPVCDLARPDAAGTNGPDIELRTTAINGQRLVILVRDHGVGVAPEDLPRVFDPYFTTKRTGSGLGLAIAKNIVEGLGGTITVSSRAGEGTEVRVELPLAPVAR